MIADRMMTDAAGDQVPVKYVTQYDRERDRIARRILARWLKARKMIEEVYAETSEDLEHIEQMAAEGRTGARKLGVKGNFQFMSFDALISICRSARYELLFDERLKIAQDIINEIVAEKATGIDEDVAEILRNVFRPTRDGFLSQARVMGLFRLKIKHPRWSEAMDLIRDSIQARKGKNLLAVRRKAHRDANWESILLDIAATNQDPEAKS
jgi:hypothetical protein